MTDGKTLRIAIAVRHGQYGRPEDGTLLTATGKEQSARIAKRLRAIITAGKSVALLSSSLPRAQESAAFIAHEFGVEIQTLEELSLQDYECGEQSRLAILKILDDSTEVAIMMTHFEHPSGIINAFAKSKGHREIQCRETKNGQGMMIDLTDGMYETIAP